MIATQQKQDTSLLSTKEYAFLMHVESQTVRRSYCLNGHYMGLKPLKLPNGRLFWSKAEALHILEAAR